MKRNFTSHTSVWKAFIAFVVFSLWASGMHVLAQNLSISGTVRNTKGETIPGVSVVVEGTANGTQTNTEGQYTLTGVSSNATVSVRFLGYKAQQIAVNGRTQIDVVLEEDEATSLDEVVIVGFGTQKKVNLTGAVGTIDSKALANRPVRNAAQALQGMAGGLNISQNNGSLESNPSINIRGTGTIGQGSTASPLVLIDGMEGSITAINPQDIENISVLKDASASSIYGSRAAFGVILVTTKKGKAGKTQVNYNNNLRSTSPVLMPEMMDSYTFALYFNDAGINGNSSPFFSEEHLQRILDYQNGVITSSTIPDPNNSQRWGEGYGYGNDNVDWYKAMFRSSTFSHEHNISLNGGSEKTTYYISGNFMNQEGMMQFNQDWYKRYGITGKINSQLNDVVAINYSMRFLREDYQRPAALTDGFYNDLGRQGWPTLPLYDPNGFLFASPSPALSMSEGGKDASTKDWLYNQLQIVLEPVKGWKTFGEFNYRIRNDFRHWDLLQTYNHDVNGVPYLYTTNSNVNEYALRENYFNTNIYSEYSRTFAEKHNTKLMLGFQAEQTKYRDFNAQRDGIIVGSIPTLDTTNGMDPNGNVVAPIVAGLYQNWATAGFFGRLNYDYDGKYLLEGNLRYDASSRFRTGSQWGLFPSVSAGWNISRESFFQDNISAVNNLKLRASYGELGNQNTELWYPTYLRMIVNTAGGSWLLNNGRPNVASAPDLVSANLTWETVRSFNVGVDWALLESKLTGSFDWFDRRTINMVGPSQEMPVILGTDVPVANNTDLKTIGFEAEVAWNDRLQNGLGYNLKLILSDNQTTITRYSNPSGSLSTDVYRAGQKLGEIWGYTTVGIAKTQEEMDAHLASLPNGGQNNLGAEWGAGDIMYMDVNGDGVINNGNNTESNPGDMRVIGNSTPRYNLGFDVNLDYKGFDFRAFFQGVLKRDYWQGSYFFWGATGNQWWSTGFVDHQDYFRNNPDHPLGSNLDAYYARPVFGNQGGKNQQVQTRYLQDASYIRLKNLQLGYTFPSATVQKFGCQALRLYASGENLWTRTKTAKMFDPETIDGGADGNVYPLSRVISLGLSVTF